MLSIVMCLMLVFSATAINIALYCAVMKRLKIVQILSESNRRKMEISMQQRKQICEDICKFKYFMDDLECLEWQCEACPLNTMD